MIMKLLAKSPDARYQSAWGLLADLKHGSDQLVQHGRLDAVDIGQWDAVSQFRYPEEPAGREREEQRLAAAYERVIGGQDSVLLAVTGETGAGKTMLIERFLRAAASRGTAVIAGTCSGEQLLYDPILQALRLGMELL